MNIYVTKGTGQGSTRLAAFDSALLDAGIANFNLIKLSSVIPSGSNLVQTDNTYVAEGEWGDRLYIVMADYRTEVHDETAWAGIGWVQDSETSKGLFVEFEGTTEEYVRNSIRHTLADMTAARGIDMGEINMVVNGVKCEDGPVCALVAAVYKNEPWD